MRAIGLFLVAAAGLFLCGCGSGLEEFPVALTRGKIVCEGQPVPHARVFFEPLRTGDSSVVGKQGFAVAEADGTFAVSTYGEKDGAVVGKHRVRVDRPHPEDYPRFDCSCVLNSEIDIMEVVIKPDTDNNFEVVLKKKTGREKPAPIDD